MIMFDWCVLNCALDMNHTTIRIKPFVLECINRLLAINGVIFFSDIHNDDLKSRTQQLTAFGFSESLKVLEHDAQPEDLRKMKHVGMTSKALLAQKTTKGELEELQTYIPWAKAHIQNFRSGNTAVDTEERIKAMEEALPKQGRRLEHLVWRKADILNQLFEERKTLIARLDALNALAQKTEEEQKETDEIKVRIQGITDILNFKK